VLQGPIAGDANADSHLIPTLILNSAQEDGKTLTNSPTSNNKLSHATPTGQLNVTVEANVAH